MLCIRCWDISLNSSNRKPLIEKMNTNLINGVRNMRITVTGGGKIGTLMAGELAYKGHKVTIYTSIPEKWCNVIDI